MDTNRVDTTVVKRCGQSAKNVKTSDFLIALMRRVLFNQLTVCIMENEIRENSEPATVSEDAVSYYNTLRMAKPTTHSQSMAEGELRMYVKRQVIETWEKLLYWQSVYLEEVRKGGGTMGHKVGSIRNQQIGLLNLFKRL